MFSLFQRKKMSRKKTAPRRLSFDVLEDRTVLSPTVIDTISFGSSRAGVLATDPVLQRVFVAEEDVPAIAVVDAATDAVLSTVPTRGFHTGMDVDPVTHRVYVAQQFDGKVRVFDGVTASVLTERDILGGGYIGDLAVNPVARRLYVVRASYNDVAVMDLTTNTFVDTVTIPAPVAHDLLDLAVDSGTNRIYLTNRSGDLIIIDGASDTVLTTVPLGAAFVAVDPGNHHLYITNSSFANTVSVVDGTPGSPTEDSVLATIPVGTTPLGVAVNPVTDHIYVANHDSNTVSVIDGATNRVVASVPVSSGPASIGLVPGLSRIYVGSETGHAVTVIEDTECVSAPTGLIAWWSGEGDATDRTGGHDGILMNGVTFAPGRVGQAFQFDGVEDYIRIPNDPALNPRDGLTIEAWINTTSTEGPHVIASKWNDNTRDWSYIFKDHNSSDKLRIELSRDVHNDGGDLSGTTSIPLGTWVHVAATYDSSTGAVRLYFNGALDASLSVGPNQFIDASITDFLIGGGVTSDGVVRENFAGLIDELAIYNRALTGAEIQAIVHAGSAGKCLNQPPTDIALSNASVAENQPTGTVVGAFSTTDPDAGDTFSYALVSGT
ncbi:MAG: hypothetical protein HYS12_28440, partial [Planctomycetes bacterium]|nr:hypothetical protein [Planctomycetota bacterium]